MSLLLLIHIKGIDKSIYSQSICSLKLSFEQWDTKR
jgi:hypothetical protein